jgi:general secretion pathway protein N
MTDRLVLLLLVGCLAFGSMIFVELQLTGTEDPAVAEAAARPDNSPAARRQQNPQVDELLTAILARPLFSSTRRPPQGTAANEADSDLADTRLTGIVTEPGRRMAIFAVNGEKPLRVAEGDAVSGWRIESITPREVSLSGPGGTKIMQPKMDPNFVSPPGQPPTAGPGGRLPIPPPVAGRVRPPVPPVAAGAGPPGSAVPINNRGLLLRPAQPPEGFPAAPRPSAR